MRPRTPTARKGDVSFNFDDADVYSVIQTIFGDVLRVNYIIDPRVKGRVNFRSVAPVAKEDVLPLMEVILRLNGVGVVEEGGLYRIVPIGDLPKEPAAVGMGRDPQEIELTGKARLQVVPIKFIQSSEMTRILTPFLSTSAVIVDVPKSNHIVIIDTDANVKRLLQLVDTFDNEKLKQVTPRIFVYAVQNSKAKDVAALLQQIFQKGGASTVPKTSTAGTTTTSQRPPIPGQPTAPTAPSPQILVGGQSTGEGLVSEITKIIPDEVTNSIVILATPEDYALILDTIQKIDIMPRQVILEGLIVQVTLTDNLSFGMSYSMNTDFKITGLKPFKNPVDLGSNSSSSGNLGVNTTTFSKVPTDGFTFIGYDPTGNIRAVLTALEDRSKAKVVAAPHILVADNREARIQVGQQIPLATSTSSQITATSTTTGIATTNTPVIGTTTVQYKDIGIILKVKPQVNDSGLISLELSQEISAVGDAVVVGGLDEVSINKTEVTSNLVARDGETIIIGGLIREDTSKGTSGVPLLSRIPILGALFGNTSDKVTRNEIIILLTPHVVRNQQEAKDVTSEYVDRYRAGAKDKDIDKFIKERGRKQEPKKEQPVEPVPNSGN
ncbi:MAG: secretin N-terminal domain-containing protein [Thermodesulfovibrionales bacterium]